MNMIRSNNKDQQAESNAGKARGTDPRVIHRLRFTSSSLSTECMDVRIPSFNHINLFEFLDEV